MLIAFEGLDQSGKATQALRLKARLERHGHQVQSLSFPDYATPIGAEIKLALSGKRGFSPEVMQMLYVANRLEHLNTIRGWVAAKQIVICDRYRASSMAYGEAQGLNGWWLSQIQKPLPKADITILLDIMPEVSANRKTVGRDKYEADLELLRRVRESYFAQATGRGWVIIRGDAPVETVEHDVFALVSSRLH